MTLQKVRPLGCNTLGSTFRSSSTHLKVTQAPCYHVRRLQQTGVDVRDAVEEGRQRLGRVASAANGTVTHRGAECVRYVASRGSISTDVTLSL